MGGTPPMEKPVYSKTKSASAFSNFSLISPSTTFSLTRFVPLVIISIGFCEVLPLKTNDFAI